MKNINALMNDVVESRLACESVQDHSSAILNFVSHHLLCGKEVFCNLLIVQNLKEVEFIVC